MKAKTKRIEYRVTDDFYDELQKFRMRFSLTMTQAITTLCRGKLNDLAKIQVPKEESQEAFQYTGKYAKNAPPKEVVVEEKSGRKIIKNEFADE